MKKARLKGRIEFNTVVIIVAFLIVFLVALGFFLGIWNISIPIIGEGDIKAECAKWQAGDCKDSLDAYWLGKLKYPILNQTYGTNENLARDYCNCPD